MEDLEASPLFFGSAGVHTTDASLKEAAMWYGGPKGRRTTPLQPQPQPLFFRQNAQDCGHSNFF